MAEQKKYSHVVPMKKAEKEAFIHIELFVTREAECKEVTVGGELRKVTNFSGVANNVVKPLNYALGETLPEADSTFFDVAVWGRDAERLAKVGKKGNLIGVTGVVKVEEHEGKKRLRLTGEGFKVVYFNPNNKPGEEKVAEPATAGKDDLPF